MEEEKMNTFTIGTAGTGGAIKVRWSDDEDADAKIKRARELYNKHVEFPKVSREGRR